MKCVFNIKLKFTKLLYKLLQIHYRRAEAEKRVVNILYMKNLIQTLSHGQQFMGYPE